MDDWDIVGMQFFIGLTLLCVLILAVVAYTDHRKAKRKSRMPPPSPTCMRDYRRNRYLRS